MVGGALLVGGRGRVHSTARAARGGSRAGPGGPGDGGEASPWVRRQRGRGGGDGPRRTGASAHWRALPHCQAPQRPVDGEQFGGVAVGHDQPGVEDDDATMKAAIISSSARRLMPAAPRKLTRSSTYRFGDLGDLDALLTTTDVDPGTVADLRAAGVAVEFHEA